jgi:predicted nucleic acid-binding protein
MLIDSNIIIYAALAQNGYLRDFLIANEIYISSITRLEVLGYYKLSEHEKNILQTIFLSIDELPVTNEIINLAISLRQKRKMSLGDSIIAATALYHSQELVTHNCIDFMWIEDLTVIDIIR